ncbi:MAG: GNAT family N-acetyltransferase [Nocardioides sp.]|uniref:GNAT family N-acetyltransferase n=1 Tax=Nocardioides sp. TaxID=35761 RepID=UPI003D6C554A
MTIVAAADGSALGNPGPAGWGWYVDESTYACGGWPHGTNNMGELTAVLDLLRQTAHTGEPLLVYCDSKYVINSVTKWMAGWKRKGWKKSDGKPVLNVEIMKDLDAAMQGRNVRFEWVKGHSGHPLNEAADRLANGAALAYQEGRTPDPGPGFDGAGAAPASFSASAPAPAAEPEDLFGLLDAPEPARPGTAATAAPGTYAFSAEQTRIDPDWVHRMLAQTYWAADRPREVQDAANKGSRCYGVYDAAGSQVAFARVVSDFAAFAWLCDVVVEPGVRGQGVGRLLLSGIVADLEPYRISSTLLATDDAHELYARYGWEPLPAPERWMIRKG